MHTTDKNFLKMNKNLQICEEDANSMIFFHNFLFLQKVSEFNERIMKTFFIVTGKMQKNRKFSIITLYQKRKVEGRINKSFFQH